MRNMERTKFLNNEFNILAENEKGYHVEFAKFEKTVWIARETMECKANHIEVETWILDTHVYGQVA